MLDKEWILYKNLEPIGRIIYCILKDNCYEIQAIDRRGHTRLFEVDEIEINFRLKTIDIK